MSADESSVVVRSRFGGSVADPTDADIQCALSEVLQEGVSSASEADLEEHPNAWIVRGQASGEKWGTLTVDVYRSGLAILSKYDDQDDSEPLYEHRVRGVSFEQSLEWWLQVRDGDEEALLRQFVAAI